MGEQLTQRAGRENWLRSCPARQANVQATPAFSSVRLAGASAAERRETFPKATVRRVGGTPNDIRPGASHGQRPLSPAD